MLNQMMNQSYLMSTTDDDLIAEAEEKVNLLISRGYLDQSQFEEHVKKYILINSNKTDDAEAGTSTPS